MSLSKSGVNKVFASKIRTMCKIVEKYSYTNKHCKAIAEINQTIILKDSSLSLSAPTAKRTSFFSSNEIITFKP